MALVAVAGDARVEHEAGGAEREADRAARGRFEQRAQRRDRSVVQVGRARAQRDERRGAHPGGADAGAGRRGRRATGSEMTATSSENGRCVIGTSNASSGSVPMPPARRSAAGSPCASPSPSASNGNSRLDE